MSFVLISPLYWITPIDMQIYNISLLKISFSLESTLFTFFPLVIAPFLKKSQTYQKCCLHT